MVQLNGNGELKKVGILGGTFDPVHNGHLAIAEEARAQLELEEVLFVPTGQPWMKADSSITPARHRVAMVRLAIEDRSFCRMSLVEIENGGVSYTVDTLKKLRIEYERQAELFFIMGWDNLPALPRWKAPTGIIELCTLVAVPRPGSPPPDLAPVEKKVPGLTKHLIILEKPLVDISATAIRERVAKGQDISGMVPWAVAEYIRENRLYSR